MARTFASGASWLASLTLRLALRTRLGSTLAAHAVSRWLTAPTRVPDHPRPQFPRCRCRTVACSASGSQHQLAGWVIEPRHAQGTIALFHGYRRSRSHLLDRIKILVAGGWRCVAFDFRAHGTSAGRLTSFGYHERDDVVAVRDFVQQRWPDQPVAALGVSMGAAAITYAASAGIRWDAVILESIYDDIVSTFHRRIGGPYPAWFGQLLPGVARVTEQRLGLKLQELSPLDYYGDLTPAPLLIVHGRADEYAPAEIAQMIHEQYAGVRELWLVDGAEHDNLVAIAGPRYGKRVLRFLERATKKPRPSL